MAKNLSTRVFDTKAELKQNRGAALANAFVVENGGTYFWNNTSTVSDDTDSVLQVTGVATGRWVKSLEITITNTPASNATYNPVTRVMNIPPADATATETTKNFATVAALKTDTFNATTGVLIANIIGLDGASFKWNPSSTSTDDSGVTTIQVTGVTTGRWEKVFSGSVRLKEVGIKVDGTSQVSVLNSLFSNTSVKEVVHDGGDVTIGTGSVNAQGKKLVINNGGKIIGTGTLLNAYVVADNQDRIFSSNLIVSGLLNSRVSVKWFGAVADDTTDNRSIFLKAISSTSDSTGVAPVVNVPGSQNRYYISDEVDITRPITLEGDGPSQTVIRFQSSRPGFKLSAQYTKLCDFTLFGNTAFQSSGYNSPTAHGIKIVNTVCSVRNIVSSFFDGDGIHLVSDEGGIADNCFIQDCLFSFNGRFGIYTRGGDSNANSFFHCNCACNARWNIMEASFLGNVHIGHQSASGANNAHSLQKTNVRNTVGGVTGNYAAIAKNTNIEPGVTSGWESYWLLVAYGTDAGPFPMWNSSDTYYSGGGIFIGGYNPDTENGTVNLNNDSTFLGCYCEPDQIALVNASRSIIIGGSLSQEAQNEQGVIQNKLGAICSPAIGSAGPNSFYRFSTSNPLYHGLYMSVDGASDKTMEAGIGFTYFRWANTYTGAWIIDPDFPLASLGLTTARLDTNFAAAGFGVYFKNQTTNNLRLIGSASQIPATGQWATGDLLINTGTINPDAIFFKCTAGGSPGTWITLSVGAGVISPTTVTTSDETPTTILTIPTVTDKLSRIEVTFLGKDTASGKVAEWGIRYLVNNTSGVVAVKDTDIVTTFLEDGMTAFDPSFSISGTSVLLKVNGGTGVTINWSAVAKITHIL